MKKRVRASVNNAAGVVRRVKRGRYKRGFTRYYGSNWGLSGATTYPSRPVVPSSQNSALTFIAVNGLSGSASTMGQKFYRLNGVYDPDVSFGGGSCTGFALMMQSYSHYVVYGVRFEVEYSASATNTGGVYVCGCLPTINNTFNENIAEHCEAPMSQSGFIEPQPGGSRRFFRGYVDVARMFGVSRQALLGDDSYQGTISTDPTRQVYLLLFGGDGASHLASAIWYKLRLTYYCRFTDPITSVQT